MDEPKGTNRRHGILVVTSESLAPQMAGPAIRAWEIASQLAFEQNVTLLTLGRCNISEQRFTVTSTSPQRFAEHVAAADVVVIQGLLFQAFPWLTDCPQVIVVDLYDPFHLETLEIARDRAMPEQEAALGLALGELRAQLRRGDYFICASARQRDLWLGALSMAGRINPATYGADPSLSNLLGIAPFGLPDRSPERHPPTIKGVIPGIGPDDRVIVWGGGVYNWFDPLTLVLAMDQLRLHVPEARLLFMGMRHPNPDVPEMRVAFETQALADSLGLTNRNVFFNDGWVPYAMRSAYLLESDLGVSCHHSHVETEFSFRTRILDYLWCGLPIVCTEGDSFADLVRDENLGLTVRAGDVDQLVQALGLILTDPVAADGYRANVSAVAQRFTWPSTLGPLLAFCRDPRRAVDRVTVTDSESTVRLPGRGLRDDVATAWKHLTFGGLSYTLDKFRARVRRRRRLR